MKVVQSFPNAGGHLIASGAGTDNIVLTSKTTIEDVIAAYEIQCEGVEAAGSRIVLMASRALCQLAKGPDDYTRVYNRVLGGLSEPAIIHWLGEMFDPALEGYWGAADHMTAIDTCLQIIEDKKKYCWNKNFPSVGQKGNCDAPAVANGCEYVYRRRF